jgi:hypothetical protein
LNEVVTYITPLDTIGVVSIDSTISVWKIQAGRSLPTLLRVICLAG